MLNVGKENDFYISEIRDILAKVSESFQNERKYNYDLLGLYNVVEYEFKQIELGKVAHDRIVSIYEKAKSLQQ